MQCHLTAEFAYQLKLHEVTALNFPIRRFGQSVLCSDKHEARDPDSAAVSKCEDFAGGHLETVNLHALHYGLHLSYQKLKFAKFLTILQSVS